MEKKVPYGLGPCPFSIPLTLPVPWLTKPSFSLGLDESDRSRSPVTRFLALLFELTSTRAAQARFRVRVGVYRRFRLPCSSDPS
eukprot:scaffold346_cov347-Pavlova_lutheri.AAC.36